LTNEKVLREAGLKNIKIIPVISSVSLRIDGMWGMLPNIRFRKSKTEKLLLGLKGYRYKQDEKGKWMTDIIVKDWTNHFADTFGSIWEADQASLFNDSNVSNQGPSVVRQKVTVGGI
jgi:hypothetical protein